MDAAERTAVPIYDRLADERGGVVAVAVCTAEQTQREAAAALDFGFLGAGGSTVGVVGDEDALAQQGGAVAVGDQVVSGSF